MKTNQFKVGDLVKIKKKYKDSSFFIQAKDAYSFIENKIGLIVNENFLYRKEVFYVILFGDELFDFYVNSIETYIEKLRVPTNNL